MSAIIELPGAIFFDVWTKEVELDEMTGYEEDIFADATRVVNGDGVLLKSPSQRITEILSRCTVRIGSVRRPSGKDRFNDPSFFEAAWKNAYGEDRGFALVRLRQLSLGDKFAMRDVCPQCGKEFPRLILDLAELKVTRSTLEYASEKTHTINLPSGKVATWRWLTGADEEVMADLIKGNEANLVSTILGRKLVTYDGAVADLDTVKRIPSRDRVALREAYAANDIGIDLRTEAECDGVRKNGEPCRAKWSRQIDPGSPSFFFPSETL